MIEPLAGAFVLLFFVTLPIGSILYTVIGATLLMGLSRSGTALAGGPSAEQVSEPRH